MADPESDGICDDCGDDIFGGSRTVNTEFDSPDTTVLCQTCYDQGVSNGDIVEWEEA